VLGGRSLESSSPCGDFMTAKPDAYRTDHRAVPHRGRE